MSEEHALLHTLTERMAERRVLVTFNGKSFDWPLLETRYRMTRKIQPRRAASASRFFASGAKFVAPALGFGAAGGTGKARAGLESRRGRDFGNDSSIFISNILRGGSPEPLVPIFHHNQMDLRGLAGLASRIVAVLADPQTDGADGLELFGVSRICERRGDTVRARKHYAQSIDAVLPAETDRAARSPWRGWRNAKAICHWR